MSATELSSISASPRRRLGLDDPVRLLLPSEKRQIAWDLFSKNPSYAQVGAQMGISAIKARDLCRQHQRAPQEQSEHVFERELSKRALTSLINGKHARKISNRAERLVRLVEIAACYTVQELKYEINVGSKTLREIECWLARKGFGFRAPAETVDNVLERLKARTHTGRSKSASTAMIESRLAPMRSAPAQEMQAET